MASFKTILALANRNGGKTMDFAIIALLNVLANSDCEIANLGAIEAQAKRCYRYMQRFMGKSDSLQRIIKDKPTISRTEFTNGDSIEVLVATISGVNSPHPHKLLMDEVELIMWPILQEAFSMVTSTPDIKGTTVLGSTRKFAFGPMQRMVDEGKFKIFQWCAWETIQPMPKDNPELVALIHEEFGDELPENIELADGYYTWDDLMEKHKNLDRDIWDTQWLCRKPDLSGLIYSRFDEALNIDNAFRIDKQAIAVGNQQIYIFEDFGNSKDHPDAILFASLLPVTQEMTIFDELYLSNMATSDMITEVKTKLNDYGLQVGHLSGWVPDPHMITQIIDRQNEGLPILNTVFHEEPKLYLIINGLPVVRKFIDERKLKITPNIYSLRQELMSYSRKKLPDGRYSEEPEKKNDHGPDALRYGLLQLYPTIALGTFGDETPVTAAQVYEEEDYGYNKTETYSGNMMNKTF